MVDLLLGLPQSIDFLAADDADDKSVDDPEDDVRGIVTIGRLAEERTKPQAPPPIRAEAASTASVRQSVGHVAEEMGANSGPENDRELETRSPKVAKECEEPDRESDHEKSDDDDDDEAKEEDGDDDEIEKKKSETGSDQPSDAPPFSPASAEDDSDSEGATKEPHVGRTRHRDPHQHGADREFVAVHPNVAARGSRLASWRTSASKTSPIRGSSGDPSSRAARFREVDDDGSNDKEAVNGKREKEEDDEEESMPDIVVSSDDSNDSTETQQRKRRLRTLLKKRKKILKKKQQKQMGAQRGGCGCCALQ